MAVDPRVGGAYFELTVDDKAFAAGMNRAETAAKTSTANIEKATTSANASMADGFKKSIGAVTSLVGAFTAAIATLTIFYNIGKKIGTDLFTDSDMERAERFVNTLQFKKAADELAELNAKIAELQSNNGSEFTYTGDIAGDLRNAREGSKELADLERAREVATIKAAKERAAAEAAAGAALEDALVKAELKRIEIYEKEQADAKAAADQREAETLTYLEDMKAERRKYLLEIELEEKAKNERVAADELDRIRRNGEERVRYAQQYRAELESIARDQQQGFGFGNGVFGDMQSALEELVRYTRIEAHSP